MYRVLRSQRTRCSSGLSYNNYHGTNAVLVSVVGEVLGLNASDEQAINHTILMVKKRKTLVMSRAGSQEIIKLDAARWSREGTASR